MAGPFQGAVRRPRNLSYPEKGNRKRETRGRLSWCRPARWPVSVLPPRPRPGGPLGAPCTRGRGWRDEEVLTMMPVRRHTPFPQYVWGTMSP